MSDNQPTAEVPYQTAVAPPSEVISPSATSGGGGPSTSSGQGLLAMIERLATNPALNIEVFDRLLAARRSEEDREAERAFNAAISHAKGDLSPVLKTRDVDFTSTKGTRTRYKYEAFADVARVVDPVFSRHGLAYRFSIAQTLDQVKVTCVVSHADGFSDRTTLEGKVDPGSTGMSMVQALGSALTYLQRYSLRAAIGLAAGVDDDGRGAGGASPRISNDQAAQLHALIEATGSPTVTLLHLVGVESVLDMNVDQWTRAKEVLDLRMTEQKARKNAPAGQ
jgi:hypothetical protein